MHLWIDGQCLQTSSRLRGIGRYAYELVRELVRSHAEVDVSISFNAALADEAIVARDTVSAWIRSSNIHVWQGIAETGEALHGYTARRQLSELALAHHVACLQPDVALSASPFEGGGDRAVPLLPISPQNFPVGCIFYDAIPHRFPSKYLNYDGLRRYYERRLSLHSKFDFMLAISEFSRREAESLVPGVPVSTIYAGISEEFLSLVEKSPRAPLTAIRPPIGNYLLYVGALDWRKNVSRVVEAFALLPEPLKQELQFYLAGDAPEQTKLDISELWKKHALPVQNLKILGHISDSVLIELYAKASAVIQPSLMEGFGLTVLEAMSCGSPVIGASAGALPEVIGLPELLFNPEDPADISLRIAQICTDKALADSAVAHGLNQAKKYSWNRSAGLTIVALEDFQRKRTHQSLDELRTLRLPQIREIPLDPAVSAYALAIAEPVKSAGTRLLIDVTATTRVDHETGIQRVVKKIATSLLAAPPSPGGSDISLIYCDAPDGFFEAGTSEGRLRFDGKTSAAKVSVGTGDVLLMLDSSWEFYESHRSVFREARIRGADIISTVYDLVPIKVPAFCNPVIPPIFSDWLKTALNFSTGVICISRAVADEFFQLLEAIQFPRPMKIGYWHLGADFAGSLTSVVNSNFEASTPLFLMVGTIEPRKGYAIALDAFDALWAKGFVGSLALVGKRGWNVGAFVSRIQNHPEMGKKLRWIEGASDEELRQLYASCDALIAASYTEGFGLPIVEAAEHGKPVIASDIPVFREVVGESQDALFFETGSPRALASCIEDFSNQGDQKLGKQPRWITWAESAKQLADVVIGGNWYRSYQPAGHGAESVLGIGKIMMQQPLTELERHCRLEVIEVSPPESEGKSHQIIVKLSNLSGVSWTSLGTDGGKFAVQLGYRILDRDGSMLQHENPVTLIPFIVGPNDHLYLAVEISSDWLDRGGKFIELEMRQEGVGWWGNPLRVIL